MPKPKFLLIVTQSEWGGAQRYVYDLAAGLKNRYEITVACGGYGLLIERLKLLGVKIHMAPDLIREIRPAGDLKCLIALYKFIKQNQFDIVHTNSSKAEILGNIAARLAGVKKIIFTAHGFVFNEPLGPVKKRLYIELEKFANRFSHKIIAVSDFDRESALKYRIARPEKITVIHNGIEINIDNRPLPDNVIAKKREEFGIPPDVILVGAIANFYPAKGLQYLVQAAAAVINKNSNIYFLLIGDGGLRPAIERQIAALHIGSKFILAGFREDAVELLKIMDIFCLSSVKEGLPYIILEALAAGLPAVAAAVGGVPEIIKNNQTGRLARVADSDGLAAAILELAPDPAKRRRLGAAGGLLIREKFNIEQMINKTIQVYEQE